MTPEKTQQLFATFPYLYRGRDKSPQESLMSWGFACGDGWFELIWTLSRQIEDAARREGLEPQSAAWPEATQVKEKFGTLRFHLRARTEAAAALIREAFEASARTCEECGMPCAPVDDNAASALCKHHAK